MTPDDTARQDQLLLALTSELYEAALAYAFLTGRQLWTEATQAHRRMESAKDQMLRILITRV